MNSQALRSAQKELQPHGTRRFPCAFYTTDCSDAPEGIVPWHWHEELEIALVTAGQVDWRIPGQSHSCREGDLILLNGNTLHSAVGVPSGQLQSLVFSPRLLAGSSDLVFSEKYFRPLLHAGAFTCMVLTDAPSCVRSFRTAFDAFLDPPFAHEFVIRDSLTDIMLHLYRQRVGNLQEPKPSMTIDSERMEAMLAFIHAHYPENITLEEISRAGRIGRRECLRVFKRTISESPIQYLLKYRLMESAGLLISRPDVNMSEISAACGFDSPSYFSKQFKRLYQCSPGEYRRSRLS